MGAAPLTGFTTATVLALPAVVVPIVLVVAAIGSGFGGSGESTVEGAAAFRGAETLWRTVGWTASIGALAALAGWAPGRRLAAGGARWLAFAAVLPLMLPGWLLFHGFWTAIGPGTFVGDLASRLDQVRLLRELALGAGLLAACWPLAAWSVAIERRGRECSSAALEAIDGLPWARRIAIAFREDRAALLRGAVMAMLLLWSTTVAFDLAGVRTFGFELRTLDAEGASTATILALGWPGLLPGIALLAIVTSLPSPREDATTESAPGGRWSIAIWSTVVLVGVPILLMAWGVLRDSGLDPEALRAFAILHGPSVLPTLAVAGSTAALAGILAAALVVAWAPAPGRPSNLLRIGLAIEALAWTVAAGMPSAVLAAAVIDLWNRPVVDWVHRSPAILVLGLLGRFGVVAVATAWWLSRRRPSGESALSAIDGPRRLGEVLAIERSRVLAAALATFAAVFSLSLGEVALSSRLAPPGDAWLATAVLNAIHYQRGETVLIAALAMLVAGVLASSTALWAFRPRRRSPGGGGLVAIASGLSLVALAASLPGCDSRDGAPSSPGMEAAMDDESPPPVPATFTVGGQGTVPGRFRTPRAVEFAPDRDALLVVDRSGRLQRIDLDEARRGRADAVWPLPEFDMGFPTGLTVIDDLIVVADTHEHRVLVLDAEGRMLETFGRYGTGPGEFVYPTDVVETTDGRLFVAEYGGNDRVQLFDADRRSLLAFDAGETGMPFRRPQSLALAPDGEELFIADACNHRVVVVDLEGRVRRVLGELGRDPGRLAYPYGIAFDGRGGLLVAEFGNNRLQRLDPATGASLGCWGGFGEGEGRLRYPWSVAVRDGRVAVLDSGNHRMMLLEIDALLGPTRGPDTEEESSP